MAELRNSLAAVWDYLCRAAPAGGAPHGGRGCTVAAVICLTSTPAVATSVLQVPSGQTVGAIEYLSDIDETGPVLRARYHAPGLTGRDDIELMLNDMAHLCETDAFQMRDTMEDKPGRIIVSLSSEPIEFGASPGDVTQYFEAYRLENGRCIWELF